MRPNVLLYANIAKGYKAGSFPLVSGATLAQYVAVTQESLLSYEAGFKFHTPDRSFSISGAGFYYDYSDKQLRAKIIDPIFGTLDSLQNIPKSRIYGFEVDGTYSPFQGLSFNLSGSILDSKITKYVGLDSVGDPIDLAGSRISYTPKYQARLGIDYSWRAGDIEPFIGAVISARSHAVGNIGGSRVVVLTSDYASSVPFDDIYKIPGYTLVDLRAGVKRGDGRWSATLFGKNVFNKFYLTNVFTDYDTISRFTGRPATYGITITAKFL